MPDSDAVAKGEGQEDVSFAFCQRLFQPVPRACVQSRPAQGTAVPAGGGADQVKQAAGRCAGETALPSVHRSSVSHLSSVTPRGTSLSRRAS
ncbi:hypothetical protein CXZ05_19690 [Arthrobacter sp. AFG20]|nr:hypothetical protein CXZ05_19690 [Arthrobacter sp. AFG20]